MFNSLKPAEQASAESLQDLGIATTAARKKHYKLVLAIYTRDNSIFITRDGDSHRTEKPD